MVLDLESELIAHLANPDHVAELISLGFDTYLLDIAEVRSRNVYLYQLDHHAKYGEYATTATLEHTFGGEIAEPASNVGWVLDEYIERYQRNELGEAVEKVANLIGTNPELATEQAAALFTEIRERTAKKSDSLSTADYSIVLDAYRRNLELNGSQGAPIGYKAIDAHIGGLKKSRLYFCIGRPKTGKSWQLLKSAYETQLSSRVAVLFSLEMSREEMYERYMCMASGVSYTRLEHGLLTDKEQAAIAKRMEELSGFGQLHIVQPTYGDRTVRKMCATARTLGADAVYIDQISFVESGRNVPLDLRHREVEYICEDLKAACSDFPIMVAAQFNREAASLGEMADLSKIGLSDAIGQKADLLMGIYASSEMMKSKLFQYGIIAARACEPKTWEIVSELSINTNFRCIGVKE